MPPLLHIPTTPEGYQHCPEVARRAISWIHRPTSADIQHQIDSKHFWKVSSLLWDSLCLSNSETKETPCSLLITNLPFCFLQIFPLHSQYVTNLQLNQELFPNVYLFSLLLFRFFELNPLCNEDICFVHSLNEMVNWTWPLQLKKLQPHIRLAQQFKVRQNFEPTWHSVYTLPTVWQLRTNAPKNQKFGNLLEPPNIEGHLIK